MQRCCLLCHLCAKMLNHKECSAVLGQLWPDLKRIAEACGSYADLLQIIDDAVHRYDVLLVKYL